MKNSHEEEQVQGMREEMKNFDNFLEDGYSQGMNLYDFFSWYFNEDKSINLSILQILLSIAVL